MYNFVSYIIQTSPVCGVCVVYLFSRSVIRRVCYNYRCVWVSEWVSVNGTSYFDCWVLCYIFLPVNFTTIFLSKNKRKMRETRWWEIMKIKLSRVLYSFCADCNILMHVDWITALHTKEKYQNLIVSLYLLTLDLQYVQRQQRALPSRTIEKLMDLDRIVLLATMDESAE